MPLLKNSYILIYDISGYEVEAIGRDKSGNPADAVVKSMFLDGEEDSFVRWWYFQGFFEGEDVDRRNFVICFFSINIPEEGLSSGGQERKTGAMYIRSVVDGATGVHHRDVRVDESLYNWYLGRLETFSGKSGVSSLVSETIKKEIEEYGVYPPVTRPGTTLVTGNDPFSLIWDEAMVSFTGESIKVDFRDEGPDAETFSFVLVPEVDFTDISDLAPGNSLGMRYVTCPRLKLEGFAGGKSVSGEAWFDYQSGGTGWFLEEAEPASSDGDPGAFCHPLGWDWCGIQLDDGRCLTLMQRRDIRSKEIVARFCVLFSPDGTASWHPGVTAHPLRTWESPRTHIHYPVEWEFRIPAIDAILRFAPDTDRQEIELIGLDGGLWEGSGSISGRLGDIDVSGRGQLELCGYGFITDISDFVERFEGKIYERLEQLFPREIDEEWCTRLFGKPQPVIDYEPFTQAVSRPVWDLISRGGKHWRPIFGILIADSLGVEFTAETEKLFVMTELLHSAALIIDDIEDKSPLRRGDVSIHSRYGTDVAINAASTLYFFPQNVVSSCRELTPDQKNAVLRLMTDTSLRAHLGQAQDIYWSNNLSHASLEEWRRKDFDKQVLQMYLFKTASATEGVAELACILKKVSPGVRNACISFSRAMGISFQIIDDVLNFSENEEWGKSPGEDLRNGKPTYVILRAIGMLDEQRSARLTEILCSPDLRLQDDILLEGIGLVRESGALEDCSEEAVKNIENEWKAFSDHVPPSPGKMMLRLICSNLIKMAYEV